MKPVTRFLLAAAVVASPAVVVGQGTTPGNGTADPWSALLLPRRHEPQPTTAAITADDLRTRLFIFSDDSMQGRLLGSKGNAEGVAYIADAFKRFGLEPAGDDSSFFQTVPVVGQAVDTTVTIAVNDTPLRAGVDYLLRTPIQPFPLRSVDEKRVIFAGDWADSLHRLPPARAAGRVVLLWSSTQPPQNPPGIPNRQLVESAYATAAAVLVVGLDSIPAETRAQFSEGTFPFVRSADTATTAAYAYVTGHAAEELLGKPLEKAQVGDSGRVVTGALRMRDVPIDFAYPARNVVAILPGSDPALRGEYVAIGAHNDHIGTTSDPLTDLHHPVPDDSEYVVNHLFRQSGADDRSPTLTAAQADRVNAILARVRAASHGASARIDSVFNGADDDGSGSVTLVEIAQYLASLPVRPKRSILFVSHVGEEWGLYGSQYFTDYPTVPRDSIVAQLNIDMIGRGDSSDVTGYKKGMQQRIHGNPDYLQLVGSRRLSTELGNLAEQVNTEDHHRLDFDYSLDANGHEQQIYCRSDHYSYARYGIPIIFFTTGGHADYHQVTDEPQYIDYDHMARVANFIADLTRHVADLDHRPVVDHPRPDPFGSCQQ
jgi:Peptidase family M28